MPNTGPSEGSRSATTAFLPIFAQRVGQADRRGGLALARGRGVDGRDQDQLAGQIQTDKLALA
jgi:hypothetical protein